MAEEEPRKRISTLRCHKCQNDGVESWLNFQKWADNHIRFTCERCGYSETRRNLNGHGGDGSEEVNP